MSRLFNNGLPQWEQNEDVAVDEITEQLHNIIVWNDDVNDFDWVIKSLIEICGHNEHQAEQCAMIIHNAGKYSVKRGTFETLRPQAEALIDRGIQATIDY